MLYIGTMMVSYTWQCTNKSSKAPIGIVLWLHCFKSLRRLASWNTVKAGIVCMVLIIERGALQDLFGRTRMSSTTSFAAEGQQHHDMAHACYGWCSSYLQSSMLKPVPNSTYIHISHGKKSMVHIDTCIVGVEGCCLVQVPSPPGTLSPVMLSVLSYPAEFSGLFHSPFLFLVFHSNPTSEFDPLLTRLVCTPLMSLHPTHSLLFHSTFDLGGCRKRKDM